MSDGNRLAGAPGHDRSALYVADRARTAGCNVSFSEFRYDLFTGRLEGHAGPPLVLISG